MFEISDAAQSFVVTSELVLPTARVVECKNILRKAEQFKEICDIAVQVEMIVPRRSGKSSTK